MAIITVLPSLQLCFVTIALSLAIGTTLNIIHALFFSKYRHIPGPRLSKITRLYLAYHDFRLTRNEKIYSWHERYGPVVLIAPGEVSFSRTGATREIYGAAGRHPKSDYFARFATYGEWPTFTVKGYDEHRDKRRLTFSLFQSTTIYGAAYVDPIRQRVRTFLDEVEKDICFGSTLDLFARVGLYVFDNMTRFAYGPRYCASTIENECQERSMVQGLREREIWNNRLFDLPTLYLLLQKVVAFFTSNPRFLNAEHELTQWNSRCFAHAAGDPLTQSDSSLLRFLMQAKTKSGGGLTRNYIASETLDNINGAQTTTTAALTYVLWNMARNPKWQQAARDELAVLDLQNDGMPLFADINNASVLDACIRESYRVNPISSGRAERIVPATKPYDGVVVPADVCYTPVPIATLRVTHKYHHANTSIWHRQLSRLQRLQCIALQWNSPRRGRLISADGSTPTQINSRPWKPVTCLLARAHVSVSAALWRLCR